MRAAARVEPGGGAVDLDDQDGAGVGREAEVERGLDGGDDRAVHHLERRRHDAGGDDRRRPSPSPRRRSRRRRACVVTASGSGTSRSVAAVTMPIVPSAPHDDARQIVAERVLDARRRAARPRRRAARARRASTWLVVTPYLSVCGPPEFSATLPPMVHAFWLEGSGAYWRPAARTAPRHLGVHDARLRDDAPVRRGRSRGSRACGSCTIDERRGRREAAAREPGAGAARHERHAGAPGGPQHARHLVGRARQHHQLRARRARACSRRIRRRRAPRGGVDACPSGPTIAASSAANAAGNAIDVDTARRYHNKLRACAPPAPHEPHSIARPIMSLIPPSNVFPPPERLLLGPGPSQVHPRVLAALGLPLARPPRPRVRRVDGGDEAHAACGLRHHATSSRFRSPAPAAPASKRTIVNLVEPGDEVVIGVNGVFGTRLTDVAERAGATVIKAEAPWGEVIPAETIASGARTRQEAAPARARPRRDVDGRLAAARGCEPARARARSALRHRLRDLARRLSGRHRRRRRRRRLLRHAEVPELSARPLAGDLRPARGRASARPHPQGAELVPRPHDAREVLGRGARLSSHGADQHELRALRGAPTRGRGRSRGALRAPPAEPRGARRRARRARSLDGGRGRVGDCGC